MAPKLSPGSTFAGYQIEDVAGSGGMGIVYKATQIALGRRVALKLIAADLARDASFRERFKREWLTAASIDHPNVIPLYEAGEADEHLFIAMRYVEGLDLAALISREPSFDPARAVNIVAQIASALDAAHKKGLVHRDVKPANILIASQDEHVYLTDFGLTKSASSQSALTKTGMFVGSLDYTAPEQIRGEAADARTDVYSLGCVLYQALTRSLPYDRDSDVAKMYAHLNEEPPAVTAARPDAPAGFDAVVARAMAKEPEGLPAFLAECDLAAGGDPRLDTHLARVREETAAVFSSGDPQFHARRVVEDLAVALQASLLVRYSPAAVADAFCAARLAGEGGRVFGTLPGGVDARAIIDRAYPV